MNRLFKVYCSSFYGCELWDLDNKQLHDFCIAWRKGLRRVWWLPNTTKSDMLAVISDSIPVYDELCFRFLKFVIFVLWFNKHVGLRIHLWERTHVFVQFALAFYHVILDYNELNKTCFANSFAYYLQTGFMDQACFA